MRKQRSVSSRAGIEPGIPGNERAGCTLRTPRRVVRLMIVGTWTAVLGTSALAAEPEPSTSAVAIHAAAPSAVVGPSATPTAETAATRDRARADALAATIHDAAGEERARRYWLGAAMLGTGATMSAMGAGFVVTEHSSNYKGEGWLLVGMGGAFALGSIAAFAIPSYAERLDQYLMDAKRGDSVLTRENRILVDSRWQQAAQRARWQRKLAGWTMILGGTAVGGIAAARAFSDRDDRFVRSDAYVDALTAFLLLVSGAGILSMESPTEAAYHYLKTGTAEPNRVRLHVVPAPYGLGLRATF